jgi:hypothetical protein
MRAHRLTFRLAASFCVSLAAAGAAPAPTPAPSDKAAPAAPEATVKMELLPSGAAKIIGSYNPQQLKMSDRKPASVKKAPELAAPLFGELRFGGERHLVVLDEPAGQDAKLYVDANGNGDLTDDPAMTWEKKTAQGPNGQELTGSTRRTRPARSSGTRSCTIPTTATRGR